MLICRNTQLAGRTTVAGGAVIGPDTTLVDCEVGQGATVLKSHCLGASIGARATVGPFTHLRPGTRLASSSKAGAFVEIKNTEVGEGAKVPTCHTWGDAQIGKAATSGPPPSSSTTTGWPSTARSSASTHGSARTACSLRH